MRKSSDSILDNWRTSIKIPATLLTAINSRIYCPRPGEVGSILLNVNQAGDVAYHREIVFCQRVGWHKDPVPLSYLLVIRNDSHILEGRSFIPSKQGPGSAFKVQLTEFHRCRCTTRKSANKIWMGLAIDFLRNPEIGKHFLIEEVFLTEIESITKELSK